MKMNAHMFVLPNFSIPPPPPPATPTQQEIFKSRLDHFMKSRFVQSKSPNQQRQSKRDYLISEATDKLRECCDAIEGLKSTISNLNDRKSMMSEDEWIREMSNAKLQLQNAMKIVSKYLQSNVQNVLKQKLDHRSERRSRIKKRKAETKERKKSFEEQRELEHKQIDRWLNENYQKIANEKRQKENEERIDEVLVDVRRRKSEAEKTIKSLELMMKLHRIRRNQKQNDKNYERNVIDELNEMKDQWQSFLAIYQKEENDIRKFMEKDSLFDAWNGVLFVAGGEDTSNEKKLSFDEFISIRSKWDCFLVSKENQFGSSIPSGWIGPPENPSAKWKQFIRETK